MTENERFSLKLHQANPCFYELLDNGESCHTYFGKWITFDDGAIGSFFVDLLNKLSKDNEQLKKENLDLLEDLAYYKIKSASLEVDYLQYQRVNSGEVTTKKTIT